jgi:hypothetical protein
MERRKPVLILDRDREKTQVPDDAACGAKGAKQH